MAGTLARARAALASSDFRRLLAARLSSQFADGVFQAFLINQIVFLSPEGQSTAAGVAKAVALLIVPFSIVEPFTGIVIDRWSRRSILAVTPLIRAVTSLLLIPAVAGAAGRTTPTLYGLALVVLALNRFYLATAGAVMPALVPDEDLLVGNSLAGATGTIVTFVGLLAGTQMADGVGNGGLLAATVVLWPVSSFAATRIGTPLLPVRPEGTMRAQVVRTFDELVRGARRLAATPAALGPIVSVAYGQFLLGGVTVLSGVVFKQEFQEGVASYGKIIGAGGVGVIAGTVTVGWLEDRLSKAVIVSASFAVAGVACLLGAFHVTGPAMLMVGFVPGLTYPWAKVPSDTMVQESIPDRYRGRVFTLYDIAFSIPRVLAALVAVVAIPHLSAGAIVSIAGVLYVLWTPVLPWWLRRPRWVTMRFHAGGRADEVPRAVVIGGAEESIEVVWSRYEALTGGSTVRRRRFRLRGEDGEIMEVSGVDGDERWRLERDVPADIADGGGAHA
jgi:MFS family permease